MELEKLDTLVDIVDYITRIGETINTINSGLVRENRIVRGAIAECCKNIRESIKGLHNYVRSKLHTILQKILTKTKLRETLREILTPTKIKDYVERGIENALVGIDSKNDIEDIKILLDSYNDKIQDLDDSLSRRLDGIEKISGETLSKAKEAILNLSVQTSEISQWIRALSKKIDQIEFKGPVEREETRLEIKKEKRVDDIPGWFVATKLAEKTVIKEGRGIVLERDMKRAFDEIVERNDIPREVVKEIVENTDVEEIGDSVDEAVRIANEILRYVRRDENQQESRQGSGLGMTKGILKEKPEDEP